MTRVSTTVAAPVRTGAQLGAGFVLVEFIAAFFAADWTERQYGAALGLAVLVVTGVQHAIENRTGHAILRDVPPTTAPVVDDHGHADATFVLVGIVVVALGILLAQLLARLL